MAAQFVRNLGRILLPRVGGCRRVPGGTRSVEEQIQEAADRYASEIRAAGERYDAAMSRILAGSQRASGSPADDASPPGECTQSGKGRREADIATPRIYPVARRDASVLKYDQTEED